MTVAEQLGITTGTAAAAAARAAAALFLTGRAPAQVRALLPVGAALPVAVAAAAKLPDGARAWVRKYSGADPDITDKLLISATVQPRPGGEILLQAGAGVGRITKAGLALPVGAAAINPAPREQLRANLDALVPGQGWLVEISALGGEALAAQTFNPRLGVKGGVSILGTSGRVRPFSTAAVKETVRLALQVAAASGVKEVALCPGHYGRRAAMSLGWDEARIVEVSNEWGVALTTARALGFHQLHLIGHPGKLLKLALGCRDTHSRRSPAAFAYAAELGEPFAIQPAGETVEALLAACPPEKRPAYAQALAAQIVRRVQIDYGLAVTARLINLAGEVLN